HARLQDNCKFARATRDEVQVPGTSQRYLVPVRARLQDNCKFARATRDEVQVPGTSTRYLVPVCAPPVYVALDSRSSSARRSASRSISRRSTLPLGPCGSSATTATSRGY